MTGGTPKPFFTVAIPTFNRGSTFLPQAVTAVLDQTCGDFELIISDNASTDGTQQYATALCDPRVRYIRRPATVPSGEHFSLACGEAGGQFVVLHQDDDLLHCCFLERARAALESDPRSNMYATPFWRYQPNHGYQSRLMRPQYGFDDAAVLVDRVETIDGLYAAIQFFDPIRHFAHPAIAMRAPALRAIGGFDPGSDYQSDLVTQAKLLFDSRLVYDPRPGGISRVHTSNFMRTKSRAFRKTFFGKTYCKLIDAFEERRIDWRELLAEYLGSLSDKEIIGCLNEWTYYRTPRILQEIGFAALERVWRGSKVGLYRKCLSKIGLRNLSRYALSRIGADSAVARTGSGLNP